MIDETRPLTHLEFNKALNYYSCIDDQTILARQYMSEFIDFMEWEFDIDQIHDNHFPKTAAWVARLLMLGVELPVENQVEYVENALKQASSKIEKTVNLVPLYSAADKISEKLAEIEGFVDDNVNNFDSEEFKNFLESQKITKAAANSLAERYAFRLDELIQASDGIDEQLREAYRGYTEAELLGIIEAYNSILECLDGFVAEVKPRAAYKRKPVAPEKQVAKVTLHSGLPGLKCQPAVKIIGAKELLCYNERYKIITVFHALNESGFSVKGSSILNFDEKKSFSKRIGRNTKNILDIILKDGKMKILEKQKDARFTNRINENVILLKVRSEK